MTQNIDRDPTDIRNSNRNQSYTPAWRPIAGLLALLFLAGLMIGCGNSLSNLKNEVARAANQKYTGHFTNATCVPYLFESEAGEEIWLPANEITEVTVKRTSFNDRKVSFMLKPESQSNCSAGVISKRIVSDDFYYTIEK